MPDATVFWTAIVAVVGTLVGAVRVLFMRLETRGQQALEELKSTQAAALIAVRSEANQKLDLVVKLYDQQIEILQTDNRELKMLLGQALNTGKVAVEVGVEQARRLTSGGDR